MEYGALVLSAESLLVLATLYVQAGLLEESRANEYRQILGFYMFTSTPEDTIPYMREAVNVIASQLKGIS